MPIEPNDPMLKAKYAKVMRALKEGEEHVPGLLNRMYMTDSDINRMRLRETLAYLITRGAVESFDSPARGRLYKIKEHQDVQ